MTHFCLHYLKGWLWRLLHAVVVSHSSFYVALNCSPSSLVIWLFFYSHNIHFNYITNWILISEHFISVNITKHFLFQLKTTKMLLRKRNTLLLLTSSVLSFIKMKIILCFVFKLFKIANSTSTLRMRTVIIFLYVLIFLRFRFRSSIFFILFEFHLTILIFDLNYT